MHFTKTTSNTSENNFTGEIKERKGPVPTKLAQPYCQPIKNRSWFDSSGILHRLGGGETGIAQLRGRVYDAIWNVPCLQQDLCLRQALFQCGVGLHMWLSPSFCRDEPEFHFSIVSAGGALMAGEDEWIPQGPQTAPYISDICICFHRKIRLSILH